MRKKQLFKGTMIVCIVYAAVSIVLLTTIKYTEAGKTLLDETNFPFAISFALGMLLVIGILVYKVASFKTRAGNPRLYDSMMCPDFWDLNETSTSVLKTMLPEERINKEYVCVNKSATNVPAKAIVDLKSKDKFERQLGGIASSMYGTESVVYLADNKTVDTTKAAISCGKLYPQYMSAQDINNNPDIQNGIRCAYSSKCGIPWSSVCVDSS